MFNNSFNKAELLKEIKMANERYLNEPLEGYLTPMAKELVERLMQTGVDKDLAIAMLETSYSDTEIYQLEDK